MELRRLSICLAFFVVAVIAQCSEAHTMQRRSSEDFYDDSPQGDQGDQGDDGGLEPEDEAVVGTILTQPANYTAMVGHSIRLECKVSPPDAPSLVVAWYRDGRQISMGESATGDKRYSIKPPSKDLIIRDLVPTDSGLYRCQIMQLNPPMITHMVTVQTPQAPRIIRFTADKVFPLEGSNLQLTCDVDGFPVPEIIWGRIRNGESGNGRLREQDGKFTANTFSATNITKEMSGMYYCYAINKFGNTQRNISVVVLGKPRVHVRKTMINSDVNIEAVLQCYAHDEENPYIRWYKDGKLIENSATRYTVTTNGPHSNLTVVPQADEDFGTFTCEAQNRHGNHSRSIDLVQTPVVEDLDVDGSKITWSVHSHQPLQAIELQLKNLNADADWRTLEVPLPQTKDKQNSYEMVYLCDGKDISAGKYEATVKVKNDKGWSQLVDPSVIEIAPTEAPILQSRVFGSGNNAPSIRQTTTAVFSTVLMYLLVRML